MLSHYTNKDLIIINPQVKSKEELFEKMVNHLYNLDYVLNMKGFIQTLREREELSNTELMPEVALPHARSDTVVKLFLSIVLIKDGLDYGNPEMGDAKIIFFFGTSDKFNKEYLQLLAKSARLLKEDSLRDGLLKCKEPDEVIDLLNEYDRSESTTYEHKSHYLMLITLHHSHRLDDLMTMMVELGITNASVIEVSTLNSKVAFDIPVFSGLYYDDKRKHKDSILVSCTIDDVGIARELAELLKNNNIDLNKKGTGFIQIIEAEQIIGNPDENLDL